MTQQLTAQNPILAGCYPDPSICRVGDDYYLIASTFEYFPGLPIFHSTDLANWQQIGHIITRADQLDYEGIRSSGGLYAPTLRHDGEKFWLVCTLVAHEGRHPGGNFVMTAPEITGEWSPPIWLDAEGIDPSIFFDDDGKIWMHGTRLCAEPQWPSQTETWLREYDPQAQELVGDEFVLWRGAVHGAVWSEAPHIYKVDGTYYLLTAEGGTDFHHAVSIARSEHITGPYVGAPTNPIFTHRTLGREYPTVGAGHADLVQARDGSWWATLLAMRTYGGYHYNLGRETFLVPVVWEDGWPVFAPGVGRITEQVTIPDSVAAPGNEPRFADAEVPLEWTTVRGPLDFVTSSVAGWRIEMRPATLTDRSRPALIAVRQDAKDCDFRARLRCELGPGEEVGVVVRQSEEDHVRCAVKRDKETGEYEIRITHNQGGRPQILQQLAISPSGQFDFHINARGQDYRVVVRSVGAGELGPGSDVAAVGGEDAAEVSPGAAAECVASFDGRALESVTTGGFLGLWFGVYATSNGQETNTKVALKRLELNSL